MPCEAAGSAERCVWTPKQDVERKLNLSGRHHPPRCQIVVTTYDLAQKLRGYERHFGVVIADESHLLKDRASQRTRFFMDLLAPEGSVRSVLFLTGTPLMSRPIELFTQVSAQGVVSCPASSALQAARQRLLLQRCTQPHVIKSALGAGAELVQGIHPQPERSRRGALSM